MKTHRGDEKEEDEFLSLGVLTVGKLKITNYT
jgi:hypothetical protein